MKKGIRITALLCAAAILLCGCGCGKKAPQETKTDEVAYIDGSFGNLRYRYPNTMAEIAFAPQTGVDGEAYGITDDEGRFFGFSVEMMECAPGDYDALDPELFLQKYFPEHFEEYAVTEVGDKENGNEIARYNGNPVFARGAVDLSGAYGDF